MNIESKREILHFIGAYEELDNLVKNASTEYEINQIARIIRKFLFDKRQVLQRIRSILRDNGILLTIEFECVPYKLVNHPGLLYGSSSMAFLPIEDAPFKQEVRQCNIDEFGSQNVGEYKSYPITVKSLITYIANKEGAVHYDQQDLKMEEALLKELQVQFTIASNSALTDMLPTVGLVVLNAVEEMYNSAKKLIL